MSSTFWYNQKSSFIRHREASSCVIFIKFIVYRKQSFKIIPRTVDVSADADALKPNETKMLGKRTGSVNQEDSSLRHDTFAKKLLTIRSFFANKQQPENKMQVTATFTKKKRICKNILCFFGILYPSGNKVVSMLIARKIQTFELKVEFQGDTWMGFLVWDRQKSRFSVNDYWSFWLQATDVIATVAHETQMSCRNWAGFIDQFLAAVLDQITYTCSSFEFFDYIRSQETLCK